MENKVGKLIQECQIIVDFAAASNNEGGSDNDKVFRCATSTVCT